MMRKRGLCFTWSGGDQFLHELHLTHPGDLVLDLGIPALEEEPARKNPPTGDWGLGQGRGLLAPCERVVGPPGSSQWLQWPKAFSSVCRVSPHCASTLRSRSWCHCQAWPEAVAMLRPTLEVQRTGQSRACHTNCTLERSLH